MEEAIYRNIEACKAVTNITKTSFGPNGMKKLIVNHIGKIFVSNDAATILSEINVHHPAANLIVMASKMQKADFGDGTNYVVTLTGELLNLAEQLLASGLHPSAIIQGYELGMEKALEYLEKSIAFDLNDKNDERVLSVIESSLSSKLPNHYKHFSNIIFEGCKTLTQDTSFNDDSFRVCKIIGGSISDSELFKGFVINRKPCSSGKDSVKKAKVVCYRCPFQIDSGDTKGTVLIENA